MSDFDLAHVVAMLIVAVVAVAIFIQLLPALFAVLLQLTPAALIVLIIATVLKGMLKKLFD